MAVVREKNGSMRGLQTMLGTTVTVDGCYVGVATHVSVEQYDQYGPIYMLVRVAMTNDTMANVREYEYIQDVMGGAENEASENHLQ